MPIYAVRLNDGNCLIGEADSESDARQRFLERWMAYTKSSAQIISVREMPRNIFLSQWQPLGPEQEKDLAGVLEGSICDPFDDCGVYQYEYPAIDVTHQEALNALEDDPRGYLNWLPRILEDAISEEASRGKPSTASDAGKARSLLSFPARPTI